MRELITWIVVAVALSMSRANCGERFIVTDPPKFVANCELPTEPVGR